MTEVSRATSGLSSISSKKLPSFNNNGFPPSSSSSSSSKHIYDGVFSSQPSDKLKKSSEFCSFGDDDYGEIFGCSKSENGGPRQSSCSSIPMLDLPVFEPKGRVLKGGRGEGIDYSGIFGGVGNGDGVDDFDQLKKKAKTFSSGPIPRSNGQTTEATRSHISSQSQNSQAPTNGFSKSFDSVKHPEWKTNEMLANENGTAHVGLVHATHRSTRSFHGVSPDKIPTIRPRPVEPLGQVHATHGSSHPVQEVGPLKTQTSRSPVIKDDTEVAIDSHLANKGKHSRKTSSDVEPKDQKNELEAVSLEESDFSKSNLPATSPATHQASTEAGPSKVVNDDAETKFSVKDNINVSGPSDCSTSEQISETETSGAVSQKVSGSTVPNSLATSDMSCQASSTVEPAKVVKDDAKVSTSFDGGKRQGRHSRVTSLDLGENKQGLDARIHRKSRLGGSYSFDASHDPLAARVKLQPSKVVPSPSLPQFFPVESHCKISENSSCKSSEANGGAGVSSPSLDEQLDVNSAAAVSAAALQRAIEEAQMKIRLAKEFLEREGQGSTKLTFKDILKARVVEENTCVKEENKFRQNKVHENCSQVGQAEMKIHLAKELLEQEGQGSSKLSSKSTLKVKVVEENKHVNEVNELSQKNTNGNSAQVDSEMQSCSRLESKSVSGTAQFVPVLDTQEKIPRYEGPIEGKNAEASISIEEDDKREGGGEWEAAKHLNQLISGVRNRLFSFMAWPAETEKKEEPKEMEASGKWLGTEKKEPKEMEASVKWVETEKKEEPKETEASAKLVETEREEPKEMEASRESPEKSEAGEVELKETEDDQCATIQASETKPGEDKLGMVPEAIEPKEYESIRSGSTEQVQGKTGDKVDLVHTEESTRTNFLFFSFTGKRPWNHPEPEVEKEEQPQESREVETEVREEQMIDEVKDEWIQSKEGEANKEGLNDNCTSQSCEKSLSGFSSEQIDEMVEEPYSMVGHEENEFAQEVKSRMLDEELGDYKGSSTDEEDNDRRVNEECIYDTIKSSPEEDDGGRLNEECNDDASKVIHDEESGGTLDEELMHEVDIDRRLNEECCDDMRRPILEEDSDQRLNEEYDVDRSRLIQEEDSYQRLNEVLEYEKETHEFIEEEDRDGRLNEKQGEEPRDTSHCPQNIIESSGKDEEEYEVVKEAEAQTDDTQMLEEVNLVGEVGKTTEASGEIYGQQEDVSDQGSTNHIGEVARGMNSQEESDEGLTNHIEEVVDQMNGWEVNNSQTRTSHTEESTKEVADQMGSIGADYESHQTNTISLSEADKVCWIDESNREAEKAVFPVEERERMTEIINSTSQPEMDIELTILSDDESEEMMDVPEDFSETTQDLEEPVVFPKAGELFEEERVSSSFSNENPIEFNGIKHPVGTNGTLPFDNLVSHESETDVNYSGQKDIDIKATESKSEDDIDKQTEHLHESRETPNAEEAALASDAEGEKSSAEAVHRRRRWFDAGAAERPNILKGDGTSMEIDQEVLEEPDLAGSVEIHADDFGSEVTDVTTAREADTALTREGSQLNEEVTHKRKRWFVKKGEQGVPEPPNLFEGTKVTLEVNSEILKESLMQNMPGSCVDKLNVKSGDGLKVEEAYVVVDGGIEKQNVEATPRRKRWFESGEKVGPSQQLRSNEDAGTSVETNQEHKMRGETEKSAKLDNMPILEKDDVPHKAESVNRDLDAAHRRKKEKIAVERAIREARERAFAEARERARRDKPNVEAHRGGSAVEDRPAKVSSDASSADKASTEAKLKAERAAVERATAEARERALRKAMSEKATRRSGEQVGKHSLEKSSTMDPKHHSSRCSDFSNSEELDGADGESLQRRQARLERQQRTMERAAKALEEKNKRDLLAQKEQAARNMLADALDAEVKRWSTGKEGNLRALLSTLQYILGSDSGWQALSLTDLVAPTAVRKAYKKATLCVHPDKLQQRGATIQQKYICEKVFDLLKEAWGKFNPEER